MALSLSLKFIVCVYLANTLLRMVPIGCIQATLSLSLSFSVYISISISNNLLRYRPTHPRARMGRHVFSSKSVLLQQLIKTTHTFDSTACSIYLSSLLGFGLTLLHVHRERTRHASVCPRPRCIRTHAHASLYTSSIMKVVASCTCSGVQH